VLGKDALSALVEDGQLSEPQRGGQGHVDAL
jgi:hypothetical protein